jgi:exonuclease III
MERVIRIVSVNINGCTSATKLSMITDFVYRQDINIVLLQEVTNSEIAKIRGYDTYVNLGTTMHGTVILTRNVSGLRNIQKIPSGRAMAANLGELRLLNIYAPSGTANRSERESFYNSELTPLMSHTPGTLIIGGDFNCSQVTADTTGNPTPSRALTEILNGMDLVDTWNQPQDRPQYTHYTSTGASRIDQIYVLRALLSRKVGKKILPAAHTDHHAVVLRIIMR